jgi:hypothetical protein
LGQGGDFTCTREGKQATTLFYWEFHSVQEARRIVMEARIVSFTSYGKWVVRVLVVMHSKDFDFDSST